MKEAIRWKGKEERKSNILLFLHIASFTAHLDLYKHMQKIQRATIFFPPLILPFLAFTYSISLFLS